MAAFRFAKLLRHPWPRTGTSFVALLLLAGCRNADSGTAVSSGSSPPAVASSTSTPNDPPRSEAAIGAAAAAHADRGPSPSPTSAANDPAIVPVSAVELGAPVTGDRTASAAADGVAASLTLPDALQQSLMANPDLVALRGQRNVNEAMVGVAQTYIWNPFVQSQFFPNGRPYVPNTPGQPASGGGQSNYYIWAMQRFEMAHQRRFRTKSALAALDQTQWNIFQGELLNVARTTSLYFAAVYQKELYDLAAETAELNERLAAIVERRFKANLARAADLTTAKVAARQSRRAADLAEMTYRAALLALRQQLNVPLTTPLQLAEPLEAVAWLPLDAGRAAEESALAAEVIEGRPDIMAAQAGYRVAEANWRLARAAMVPDVQAGPIYETADDGTRYIGFRMQMEMPVWNTGAPLARQRRAEMNQSQLTYEQLKVRAPPGGADRYRPVRSDSRPGGEGGAGQRHGHAVRAARCNAAVRGGPGRHSGGADHANQSLAGAPRLPRFARPARPGRRRRHSGDRATAGPPRAAAVDGGTNPYSREVTARQQPYRGRRCQRRRVALPTLAASATVRLLLPWPTLPASAIKRRR